MSLKYIKIKKSEIFWTSLLALMMILFSFYCVELVYAIWLFGTYAMIAQFFEDVGDPRNSGNILWMVLMPITWISALILLVYYIFVKIYRLFILPFNEKLNKN